MLIKNRFPHLEIRNVKANTSIIIDSFDHIRDISICWVAMEVLEAHYQSAFTKHKIHFSIEKGTIIFKHKETDELMAKIFFDKSLNIMEQRTAAFYPLVF